MRNQRAVHHAGEIFQLRPQHLAMGEVPQLVALQEIARQSAHLREEQQVALLVLRPVSVRLNTSTMPTVSKSVFSKSSSSRKLCGIGGLIVLPVARPGMRRHQHAFAGGKKLIQQPSVLGL